MKISGIIRDYARKVSAFLNPSEKYPRYKYCSSVQIPSDMGRVIKDLKQTKRSVNNITSKVLQNTR